MPRTPGAHDQFAAGERSVVGIVKLQQREQVTQHDEGDVDGIIPAAKSQADKAKGAMRFFARHRHDAKRKRRARFDVAPHHTFGPRFQNAIIAFIQTAVIIPRAGEPGYQPGQTFGVREEEDVAGQGAVGPLAFGLV